MFRDRGVWFLKRGRGIGVQDRRRYFTLVYNSATHLLRPVTPPLTVTRLLLSYIFLISLFRMHSLSLHLLDSHLYLLSLIPAAGVPFH